MNTQEDSTIVQDIYDNYTETQKEIYIIETKKVRKLILAMAIMIFLFDFIAISTQNNIILQTILVVLVVPVIFTGLAFLALREPMVAIILCSLIILGIWTYVVSILGARGLINGWLIKAILITMMLAALQHARTAQAIKKELKR